MNTQTRKVLMVAYYFPPIAATGAMRPLNLSRHLPAYGWLPRILATDPESALPAHSRDEKLLDAVPPEVHILRVPHLDLRGRLLALRDLGRRTFSKSGARGRQEVSKDAAVRNGGIADGPRSRFMRAGKFIAEALLEYPDRQCFWYRPAIRAFKKLAPQERPDVVWATGGPWTSLLVGQRLAEYWRVPFIADFRDPWYSHSSSATIRMMNSRLERSVFSRAAKVILNTEEVRAHYGARYPEQRDKLITLTNGYPSELESFYRELGSTENVKAVSPLEICHFGTVYWMRMPTALFRAVEELVSEGKLDSSKLRLRFVGGWERMDHECERLANILEEKGVLRREAPLPHSQCLTEMAHAGVLLILQPDAPLQIPAKLYEYIVAGRPIWVVGGEGATTNLVRRHRLGSSCPNKVADIKRALTVLLEGYSEFTAPGPADTAQFSYQVLAGKLAEILNGVAPRK